MIKLIPQEHLTVYHESSPYLYIIFFDMDLLFSFKEVFDKSCLDYIINIDKNNPLLILTV